MNRKGVIVAVTAIALMLAGIVWAVYRLYSKPSAGGEVNIKADVSLLKAVPSDAALVFYFDGSRDARNIIADSCGVLGSFLSKGLMDYLSGVGAYKTAVSLHNNGALVPLVVSEVTKSDSLERAGMAGLAPASGLKSQLYGNLIIASGSETLISASIRHLDDGLGVLSSPGMKEACAQVSGPAVVYISHAASTKLLQTFGGPKAVAKSQFARSFADWTAMRMEAGEKQISLKGGVAVMPRTSGYMSSFEGMPVAAGSFASVLPSGVLYALSIPVSDADDYLQRYRTYQDSGSKLNVYDAALADKCGNDKNAQQWYKSLDLKEIVCAAFRQEGRLEKVLLLRCAQDGGKKGSVAQNPYRGYAGKVFGESFAVEDSLCLFLGSGWRVYGNAAAIDLFRQKEFLTVTLKDRLQEAGIQVPQGQLAYVSLGEAPEYLPMFLDKNRADAVLRYISGASYAPLFAVLRTEGNPAVTLTLDRRMERAGNSETFLKDTSVVVPAGPYPVINYSDGATYSLYQNNHLSICLNDDKGKGVWGIPFKMRICGRVENIDYYNNGRKQFLFAAGSSLYLLDVKGRFVQGFPVDLGKPVRLGPAAYDFTGAGGYTVMVLHKDNTLQMYNLHGKKPSTWKGIAPEDKIRTLPELYTVSGKKYWLVSTASSTLMYPFDGGEPLPGKEAEKLLRK